MKPFRSYEDKREWVERTLLDLREGCGSALQSDDLRALLMEDREARLIYLRFNQLDYMLETPRSERWVAPPAPPARARLARFPWPHRSHLIYGLVGAGIAAAVILMATSRPSGGPRHLPGDPGAASAKLSMASLQSDYNAVIGGKATTGARSFGEGPLSLDRGIAQLAFRNGAQIVLEGNCGFEIIDAKTVVLNYGKMWAHCPLEANGFKVLTPGGREIIDLGTEFAVEVLPGGGTAVHVFDGLVDVVDPATEKQRIEAGSALYWPGGSAPPRFGQADISKFVTTDTLTRKRLNSLHSQMLDRTDLLLYYDFSATGAGQVRNRVPGAAENTHGHIRGTTSVSGRSEDLNALQFEHPGDAVALHFDPPTEIGELTLALWVKVDRLAANFSALFNSSGWEPGDMHFQVTRDGSLRAGMNGGMGFASPSGVVLPGRWQLLAVTWDLATKTAQLSCDGRPLTSTPIPNLTTPATFPNLRFGACQIGSWGIRPQHSERNFKGRVDEVMIFDHALSAGDLAELYTAGSP